MQLLVVKRGRFNTFKMLEEQFAGVPDVQVVWERRAPRDRRERAGQVPAERRGGEQRRRSSEQFSPVLDYMVVNVAKPVETLG
jgi:hypothetical protein